jgi:large subunit ribosomal protein L43
MATNGLWYLRELTLKYAKNAGSSAGVRQFIQNGLGAFASKNPQLKIKAVVARGNKHPVAIGDYGKSVHF